MSTENTDHVRSVIPNLRGDGRSQRRQLAEVCVWATSRRIVLSPQCSRTSGSNISDAPAPNASENRQACLLELVLAQAASFVGTGLGPTHPSRSV